MLELNIFQNLFNRILINYLAPGLEIAAPFLTHGVAFGVGILTSVMAQYFSGGVYYRTKKEKKIMAVASQKPIEIVPKEIEQNPYKTDDKFVYPVLNKPKIDWHGLNVFVNKNQYELLPIPKEIEQKVLASDRLLEDKNAQNLS